MPVPSKMADLYTIPSSNSPSGSEAIGNSLDDYLRSAFSILRSTNALSSFTLASASTVDLGTADAEHVQITGTATIASFGTSVAGLIRECRFTSALTITASSNIVTPNSADIAVAAGDVLTFRSMGAGVWRLVAGTSATKLATARAFNLAGVVTATGVNFDGTGNVTLTTTIADGALSIAKTSGLQGALNAKANVIAPDLSNNQASASASPSFTASGGGVSPSIAFLPRSFAGAFNSIIQNGDSAFVFGDRADSGYAFCIAPWGSSTGGLRISNNGAVSFGASVSVAGSVTAAGGFQASDRRLKRNIQRRAVQRGFALKLARMFAEWDRIADGVHDVGLIAQRVKTLAARYVIRGPKQGSKAGMLAIDKSGIALEASMDCALQLDEQTKTIKALLRRIEKLEKTR